MKILLGLISSNLWICNKFDKEQGQLVPEELRSDENVFSFKVFNPEKDSICVHENLRNTTRAFDAVLLLIEWRHENEFNLIRNSFFTYVFRYDESYNYGNFFRHKIGILFKNFRCLNEIAERKSEEEQLIILPIRNFASPELIELVRVCREENINNTFNNMIGPLVKKLRHRRMPRRNTNDQKKYIVDDEKKYFEFGKDKAHGQIATGGEHLPSCEIAGNFRFGRKISQKGHFNVTCDNKANATIGGIFPNCHDVDILVSERLHINMFVNDYVRGEETKSV